MLFRCQTHTWLTHRISRSWSFTLFSQRLSSESPKIRRFSSLLTLCVRVCGFVFHHLDQTTGCQSIRFVWSADDLHPYRISFLIIPVDPDQDTNAPAYWWDQLIIDSDGCAFDTLNDAPHVLMFFRNRRSHEQEEWLYLTEKTWQIIHVVKVCLWFPGLGMQPHLWEISLCVRVLSVDVLSQACECDMAHLSCQHLLHFHHF